MLHARKQFISSYNFAIRHRSQGLKKILTTKHIFLGTSHHLKAGWRPTDRYVQFISKLDRKHCRMLVGLLIGHINLQYMLHKIRRAKTPSRRRYGVEKETSVHILWNAWCWKGKDADLGFCQDRSGTNKRYATEWDRAFNKRAQLLNSPLWI